MLQFQLVVVHLALVITLLQWHSSSVLLAEAAQEKTGLGGTTPHTSAAAAAVLVPQRPGILPPSRTEFCEKNPLEPSAALGVGAHPVAREEKSSTNLEAKLFLLDELMSLENEVTETKKKRSFPGFGCPIDRISSASVDVKGKQRKVVELPKRRFGVPLDRIGVSPHGNSKG